MKLLQAFGQFAGQAAVAEKSVVLLTPTSISYSGTSATINPNGSMTLSAVTSLSVNGVFSSDYGYYVMNGYGTSGASNPGIRLRLRAAGSDASGSDYVEQLYTADGGTLSRSRTTVSQVVVGEFATGEQNGYTMLIYGPHLAAPTAIGSDFAWGLNNSMVAGGYSTHGLSTSYDGFTIAVATGDMTGVIQVYGVRV